MVPTLSSAPSTRDVLCHAALELFERKGYTATSAADIATAAGVSERTFYRHFRSKELPLFPDQDRIRALVRDLSVVAGDTLASLTTGLRLIVEWRIREADLWRRRYALIDATPELLAFDRSLDVNLLDLLTAKILDDNHAAGDTAAEVEARSMAAMVTIGGAYILRAAARGEQVSELIDDLAARANRVRLRQDPAESTVTVVITGDLDVARRRRVERLVEELHHSHP